MLDKIKWAQKQVFEEVCVSQNDSDATVHYLEVVHAAGQSHKGKESSAEASSLTSFCTVCHPDKHENLIFQCCLIAKRCHNYLCQHRHSAASFVSLSNSCAGVVAQMSFLSFFPHDTFPALPKMIPYVYVWWIFQNSENRLLSAASLPFAWHRSRKELVWAGNHQASQSNKFHYYNENPKTWKQYTELPWLILLRRHT